MTRYNLDGRESPAGLDDWITHPDDAEPPGTGQALSGLRMAIDVVSDAFLVHPIPAEDIKALGDEIIRLWNIATTAQAKP